MNCFFYCLFHVLDAAAALFIGVVLICNSLLKLLISKQMKWNERI